MNDQLIDALKAAVERIAEQRKALRHAAVLLRVYPQGLVFSCHTSFEGGGLHAWGHEGVLWDDLPSFHEIVDRVCAKAHAHLGTKPPASLRVVQ